MSNNFNPGFDREKAAFLELANRGDGLTPIDYLYAKEANFGSVLSSAITGGTAEFYTIYVNGIESSNITNSNDIITNSLKLSNQLNDYYVGFTAGSLTQSTIWSLPLQDGTDGQVLATNGSGILSFIDTGGGGEGAPKNATYIIREENEDLPNAQVLSSLEIGIAKIETEGYIAIAVPDVDYATVETLEELAAQAEASATEASDAAIAAAASAADALVEAGVASDAAVAAAGSAGVAGAAAITAGDYSNDAKDYKEKAREYKDEAFAYKDEASSSASSASSSASEAHTYLETLLSTGLNELPNSGDVNINNYKIINLANGVSGTDAVNVNQLSSAISGSAAPNTATYIVQTANSSLTNAQVLGSLSTGLLKNTTTTGVLSIATAGTDYYSLGNPTTIKDDSNSLFIGNNSGSFSSLSAGFNTGIGIYALSSVGGSTTGDSNVAVGYSALKLNTSGYANVAIGYESLISNISGFTNVAIGPETLRSNQSGQSNIAVGYLSLASNITGSYNIALGENAIRNGGTRNVGIGDYSLYSNTSFNNDNTAIGYQSGNSNIYSGASSCVFLGSSTTIGANNLTNAIAIGYNTTVSSSNSMRLGNGCNVGINQASPVYPLHISNVSNISALYLEATTSTPSIPASGGLMYTSGGELYYKGNSKTVSLSSAGNPAPNTATYIVQTANASLTNEQVLGSLSTGLLKNTTTTGVLSIATAGTDYYSPGNPTTIIDIGTFNNLFVGTQAGNITLTGSSNSGFGYGVLTYISNGTYNSSFGYGALGFISTGNYNTGIGGNALSSITTQSNNVSIGYGSGTSYNAYNNCTFIGSSADTTVANLTNAIAIGYNAQVSASNAMRLGNSVNVGINQASPAYPLHISNVSNISALYLEATTNTPSIPASGGLMYTSGGELYYKGNSKTVQLSAFPIPLSNGGTNASLTASNGGIVYSTASALAILSGTATAGQILRSGASSAPSWSTATYPATTTANQILYSSAANTITGLTTANSSILATNGSGVPSLTTTLPFTVPVITGGTGLTSTTAYGVLCGGTTSTGNFQNAGTGTLGQVYVSGGASAVGSWQNITNAGAAPNTATYIVQTANASLTNAQVLGSLSTGLLKNTTTTGVLSIAIAGTDYYSPGNPTTIRDNGNSFFIGTNSGNVSLTGINNTGIGVSSLNNLTTGNFNTAVGSSILEANTTGSNNVGIGYRSLYSNVSGIRNTAGGSNSLYNNQSGQSNTAFGYNALYNTLASYNTAIGSSALAFNITGTSNFAGGYSSLSSLTSGTQNVAVGVSAGSAYTTYNQCTFIGCSTDASVTSLTNATAIGYNATVSVSNAMVLGNSVNVGINQASPAYPLHISNVSNISALYLEATTNTPSIPASGGLMYTSGGELYYKGNSKTVSLSSAGNPAPNTATYIVQTANASLTNAQVLGSLSTGLLKNTTTTGVLSIATAGTDYYVPGNSLPQNTQLLGRCMLSSANTSISTANNTWIALAFNGTNQTTYDPSNWHSDSTNNTRVTPGVIGTYKLTGALRFNNSGSGVTCGVGFGLNGATPSNDRQAWFTRDTGTGRRSANYICIITTTATTDYFELMGQQDSGGTLALLGYHFQLERLS